MFLEFLNKYLAHILHPEQMTAGEWLLTVLIVAAAISFLTAAVKCAWHFNDPPKETDD